MKTLLGDGILEHKLQQRNEMMQQQSMKYKEERVEKFEQQQILQAREAANQVEQRFAEVALQMEYRIAESAHKQEVNLNDKLESKCASMTIQIEALL